MRNIKWIESEKDYEIDSVPVKYKTYNPKAFISYDEFTLIDKDTLHIYFDETPTETEDSISVKRIWDEVTNDKGESLFVFLFYYKESNMYMLRVLKNEDDTGTEYFMNPFKLDTIPTNQDSSPQSKKQSK